MRDERPKDVDSVELAAGKPRLGFAADDEITIDGVAAERQRTTCTLTSAPATHVCVGVYLPSLSELSPPLGTLRRGDGCHRRDIRR